MSKIEVRYKGIVIGHTYDGVTIEFLDSKEALEVKDTLFNSGQVIGVSSRAMGTIKNGGAVNRRKPFEYNILEIHNKKDKK